MATFPAGDKELQPGSDLQLRGQALNPCLPAGRGCGPGCPASQSQLCGVVAFPGITQRAHRAQQAGVRQPPTQQMS